MKGNSEVSKYEEFIKPYRQKLLDSMHSPLGYTSIPLIKEKPESSLGKFLAEAMYREGIKEFQHIIRIRQRLLDYWIMEGLEVVGMILFI